MYRQKVSAKKYFVHATSKVPFDLVALFSIRSAVSLSGSVEVTQASLALSYCRVSIIATANGNEMSAYLASAIWTEYSLRMVTRFQMSSYNKCCAIQGYLFFNKMHVDFEPHAYNCYENIFMRRKYDATVGLTPNERRRIAAFENVAWQTRKTPCDTLFLCMEYDRFEFLY